MKTESMLASRQNHLIVPAASPKRRVHSAPHCHTQESHALYTDHHSDQQSIGDGHITGLGIRALFMLSLSDSEVIAEFESAGLARHPCMHPWRHQPGPWSRP